jgi:tol-pal system protein YbgF
MRSLSIALAFGAALAAPMGATAALFSDDEAREQISQLKQRVDADQRAIEERIAKLEAAALERRAGLDRSLLDLSGQIEGLRADLARMRGDLEVLVNQIETTGRRQKDLYVDVDTRLRKLELAQQQAQQAAAAGTQEKPPAEPVVSPAETKAYEAALNQFKLGNYLPAITAFQGFLTSFPSSQLAPSAQYWIGNAHYAMREYRSAIEAQQKVLSSWPEHAKAPDAMLNIASSKDALGDKKGAQRTLEELIEKYPASPAAASAKQRLAPGTRR